MDETQAKEPSAGVRILGRSMMCVVLVQRNTYGLDLAEV